MQDANSELWEKKIRVAINKYKDYEISEIIGIESELRKNSDFRFFLSWGRNRLPSIDTVSYMSKGFFFNIPPGKNHKSTSSTIWSIIHVIPFIHFQQNTLEYFNSMLCMLEYVNLKQDGPFLLKQIYSNSSPFNGPMCTINVTISILMGNWNVAVG